ncbi:MAG: peptidase M14 [Planctomycetes bacterium]|nr:peptidase M14 [Planctomycetota bacterium]NOG53416.1 peptidase M14 [Planctomycetota bacterium]
MARITPRLTMTALAAAIAVGCTAPTASAQYAHESKVDLRFDHWYDYREMTDALHELVDAYPDLLTIESIGKSVQDREMWLVTMNNPKTGPHTSKTAMFIDGNIHGNEIQAAETVLYSIWYLTKSYGKVESLTKIIDERAFYFLPMENPDGRDYWFHQPNTPSSSRSGQRPVDNDHDGEFDEDPPNDIDGDGNITQMYARDPLGQYKIDPDDDRFFTRVGPDEEPGGWSRVGQEGIDDDGDGRINEDGPGGYDPNRNWPSDWQPEHIQYGATDYPFSLPECRAIGQFLIAHPNVAAYQSYHNSGGMILRGPAASYISYPRSDIMVYEQLMEVGGDLLPFYREMATSPDLYTVHGGETDWTFEGLGIFSFTNELWTDNRMYMREEGPSQEERKQFRDLLQFGDVYVPYTKHEHPTLGTVYIGGTTKFSSRVTPVWMLEEGCHRNFAFTMFHADQMPLVKWGLLQVKQLNNNVWEVTVEVQNPRIIPTIASHARSHGIGKRDYLLCESAGRSRNSVVASGTVSDLTRSKLNAVEHQPERLWNDGGIRGKGTELFRFLVNGSGSVRLTYYSEKGGTITQDVELTEQIPEPKDADLVPSDSTLPPEPVASGGGSYGGRYRPVR